VCFQISRRFVLQKIPSSNSLQISKRNSLKGCEKLSFQTNLCSMPSNFISFRFWNWIYQRRKQFPTWFPYKRIFTRKEWQNIMLQETKCVLTSTVKITKEKLFKNLMILKLFLQLSSHLLTNGTHLLMTLPFTHIHYPHIPRLITYPSNWTIILMNHSSSTFAIMSFTTQLSVDLDTMNMQFLLTTKNG